VKPTCLAPILLTIGLLLSSCNMGGPPTENPGAKSTSAAQTVQADLTSAATPAATQTAGVGPLATQPVSVTPTPTAACEDSATHTAWTRDNAVYDVKAVNTPLAPGKPFVMSWTLQNTGSCTWDSSYQMSYESGTSMTSSEHYPVLQPGQTTGPGESVTVDIEMTAPGEAGDYQATWILQKDQGEALISFGVSIKVGSPGSSSLTRPGGLTYTYDCTTGSVNISLSWSDAANGEDGYRIYRDGTKVADLASGSTSYSEIAPGAGTYTYKVAAFDATGESPSQVSVNTSNCE
jgi:hypothetical protein